MLDKPKGITSFDVIRRLRARTGVRKFGHAGTLDPLASGLMLVGAGPGTKQLAGLVKLDKEYVAEVLIGEQRTTGDMEGEVVDEKAYSEDLTVQQLRDTLAGLVGELTLPVSSYSAIKVGGRPLYKKARAAERRGQTIVDLPMRTMTVYEAELIEETRLVVNQKSRLLVTIRFKVGSGTYVRSLAEEYGRRLTPTPTLSSLVVGVLSQLAQTSHAWGLQSVSRKCNQWKQQQCKRWRVGYPATLYNLRRTKVGEYHVEDAQTLETLVI